MKKAIQSIDRALIDLYAIDSPHQAQNFLMPPSSEHAAGALLVATNPNPEEVAVGIVLHPDIAAQLTHFEDRIGCEWSREQAQALAVATEEVSHFRYLVFHAASHRPISELEMEFQAEVDKFLVLYFSQGDRTAAFFEELYDLLFETFRLVENLGPVRTERYAEANRHAKRFIAKIRVSLTKNPSEFELLGYLRTFYRMTREEKLSLVSRD